MNDEEEDYAKLNQKLKDGWLKLKSFKKLYKIMDMLGNIAMIIALIMQEWITAFLLFVVFFPDEVEIIRFFKRLLSSSRRDLNNHHNL